MPLYLITWVRACTEMITNNYHCTRSLSHTKLKASLSEHSACILFQKKNSISARRYIIFSHLISADLTTRLIFRADARFMVYAILELLNKSNISSVKMETTF